MQKRYARLTVMTLLLASGLTAAYFLWAIDQRSNTSIATQTEVSARLARMSETIAGIGAAQQGYVAPGQLDEPWFERTSALVAQLSNDTQQARARLRSPGAAEALQTLAGSTEALMAADARTRENLRLGQELMASDVIFSDGRNILDAMIAGLRDLQAAEHVYHRAGLSALSRERWITLGATALFWVAGLFALVTIPATGTPAAARQSAGVPGESSDKLPAEQRSRVEPAFAAASADKQRPVIDLASAASLCTDFSRVTDAAALPDLLGRTARVLDASGVILWMSAGEQLFPVMGHGYRADMLARLRPIARDAENGAAAAWRTQQLTIVGATGPTDNGAIVAPLFGLHACIGVLAAEVRRGGEYNPATQALATIIAAQLATVVPAWPAPSLTQPAGAAQGIEPAPAPKDATREARSA